MAPKHDEVVVRIMAEAGRREVELRQRVDETARLFAETLNSSLCRNCQGHVAAR